MSDTDTDPVLQHLRDRAAELIGIIENATAKLEEVRALITVLSDGRTRIRRRLREVPPPPDSAPGDAA
jgi:hypothetical protein